ncbi:MAG: chorismate lyase [Porticoccaceae bacterium]|nr:chorismate lyase [Porticoccaceae bacterium]
MVLEHIHPLSIIEPTWRSMLSKADPRVPNVWRDWLSDSGSLTERLLDLSRGDLKVRVLRQNLEVPRFSERQLLDLSDRRRAMVREVILYGSGKPWVFARSILPLPTLTGRLKKLRQLSDQPLGELLFNDPTMRREPVQYACFDSGNKTLPSSALSAGKENWGRRSVFKLDNKPLLVAEVFLTDFNPYN